MFPKWLPHLSLTNHQMRGEVLVHMLKTTDCITLKYNKDLAIKIAPRFIKFLRTFPANEGFEADRNLNFPHIHWYNYNNDGKTLASNPDVDLMLACPKLERVGLTWHYKRINFLHPYEEYWTPMTLDRFLSWWKLSPMLGCDNLKHVYIGGIHARYEEMDKDQMHTIVKFGAWLRKEFAKKTPKGQEDITLEDQKDVKPDGEEHAKPDGQKVHVTLHRRYGAFQSWGHGEEL
ncbi:hypothetical protein DPSP01_006153 [Paraphaeosphaeria sporulosa]